MLNHRQHRKQAFRKIDPVPSWRWAEQNVDYSQAQAYDTPYKGVFDADLMPFWKEPLEAMQDPSIRELAIIKAARAGYSENLLLTDLRYTIARNPEPTMYISGTMEVAKGFHDRRVCRGMSLSKDTEREFRHAKTLNTEIQFPSMDFRSTWATSNTATKSDGWARIYCDEVSLWSEFGVDAVRRRCAAYPFHHICFGGSIDPTRKGDPYDDPMVKLYEESDKREWVMHDGVGEFTFTLSGIKWPEECKNGSDWDLEAVAREAWYETSNGVRIDEADRMRIVRAGHWQPTADGIRRGYKIVAPMVPFADCSFGQLAKRFLSAKNRGQTTSTRGRTTDTLRIYFAENWAEPHYEKKLATTEEELVDRVLPYQYGTHAHQTLDQYRETPRATFATIDVQKTHLWLCVRTWYQANAGDSTLVLFQRCEEWADAFEICQKESVERIYCDAAYANRQQEVYEVASRTPGFVPVIDNARLQGLFKRETIDPYEGTRRQGTANLITRYVINPGLFRYRLMEMMRGESDQIWSIPRGTPMEYQAQVTAEQFVAGEWKRIRRDNHAWDTEVLQTFAATRARILLTYHDQSIMEQQ
jgi:hypothetical protein